MHFKQNKLTFLFLCCFLLAFSPFENGWSLVSNRQTETEMWKEEIVVDWRCCIEWAAHSLIDHWICNFEGVQNKFNKKILWSILFYKFFLFGRFCALIFGHLFWILEFLWCLFLGSFILNVNICAVLSVWRPITWTKDGFLIWKLSVIISSSSEINIFGFWNCHLHWKQNSTTHDSHRVQQ